MFDCETVLQQVLIGKKINKLEKKSNFKTLTYHSGNCVCLNKFVKLTVPSGDQCTWIVHPVDIKFKECIVNISGYDCFRKRR